MKVDEVNVTATLHHPVGRNGGINAARKKAHDATTHATRKSPCAPLLAERVEHFVSQHFQMHRQVWRRQIYRPTLRLLDPASNLSLDLWRGERVPLVSTARRHSKRPGLPIAQVGNYRIRNLVQVAPKYVPSLSKVGNTEY